MAVPVRPRISVFEKRIVGPEIEEDLNFYGQDLYVREFKEFGGLTPSDSIPRPISTLTTIDGKRTWAVKYYGDEVVLRSGFASPQSIFLFPIATPAIAEAEFSGPPEWNVVALGMVGDIVNHNKSLSERLARVPPEDRVAVLQISNRFMTGLKGQDMSDLLLVQGVTARVLECALPGDDLVTMRPIYPRPYFAN